MAKYAEGNVPYTAVFNTDVSASDVNAANLQLATMLGPLVMPLQMHSGYGDVSPVGGSAADWIMSFPYSGGVPPAALAGTDPPEWRCQSGVSGEILYLPIPWIRAGMKITTMSARTKGSVAGADPDRYNGVITLASRQLAADGAWTDKVTISSDPFASAGAWQTVENLAVAHTVLSGYEYAAVVRAGRIAIATPGDCYISAIWATVQMGN